ncbi:MAG: hypothetical protein ABIR96_12970 [Bdellovibrionota bacterium]
MSKGQDTDSTLFYYDHSRRSLSLSVGTQHLLFRGVQFNIDAGLLISSPSASHVHDSRGLRVGAQITRRYLGGNTHVSYWDYRVQLFTEHNEVLASGTARVEELLNLDVRPR